MKKLISGGLLAFTLSVGMSAAQAVPIAGLFNTGLDAGGTVVTPFSAGGDAHYTLEGSSFPLAAANVIDKHPAWIVAPAGSQWIGAANDGTGNAHNTIFEFTTTFDLTGLNPNSATIGGRVAADDFVSISLNGVDTGFAGAGFISLPSFTISSGFVAGINVLTFHVFNSLAVGANPMGLLVTDLAGTADLALTVPLPGALPLCLIGLLGMGMVARRRAHQ